VCFLLGDARFQNVEGTVEIGFGDDQRRAQIEHAAHAHLEAEAAIERPVEHAFRGLRSRRLGRAVADQIDAEQQPLAADIADQRMTRLHVLQPRQRPRTQTRRTLDQPLVLDDLDRG